MGVTVVRYKTKPDRADENQALIGAVFAELDAERPEGLRYLNLRLRDGVTFVHVASIDTPDGANPLTSMPTFGAFQQDIADRCDEPPLVMEATVVGSFRFPTG
jgi:hypothetical protein